MEQEVLNTAQQNKEIVITSGPRLTIETTADFVQRIRQGLADAETVVIEFAPEVEMDITALQVFCSACRTAATEKKRFTHRGPVPKALIDLATAAGSERHDPCSNNNQSCFRQFEGVSTWEN
jgi:hypothetical protein